MQVKKFIYEYLDIGEAGILASGNNDNRPVLEADLVPDVPFVDNTPKPVYTEEEMQLGKNLSKDEGIRMGQELAKSQFLDSEAKKTEELMALVQKLEAQIAETTAETQGKVSGLVEKLKIVALAAAKKVTGAEGNAELLEGYIGEQLKKLSSKGEMKIIVNPASADLLAGKFKAAQVTADENVTAGDFRIEWDGGFAERNADAIWKEVEDILRK